MPESHTRSRHLLLAAYIAIASGTIIFIAAFVIALPEHLFKGTLILSASFTTFGTGEYLNHPKQKLITQETVKTNKKPKYHRNRNPCSLGNLFDIGGLLLLFIAFSSFFFSY